jgi:hypothetical protein
MRKRGGYVLELFNGGADGLQYKEERERVGVPPFLLHIEIKGLDAIQPG